MPQNKLAIASISLGQHASHTLPSKILSGSHSGIQGIEVVFKDLEDHALAEKLCIQAAATDIRKLCTQSRIQIISLAAFEKFEGSRTPLTQRMERARLWLEIAQLLGAEYLQVPSNFERDMNLDRKVHVRELQRLADEAAKWRLKVAYENLAWSKHCHLWQQAVEIVREVDRENFGLCLDSFHLAAALWGDPFVESGKQVDGKERLAESLREPVRECPLEKLFYLQLSGGERVSPPYSGKHLWYDPDLEVGHVWSNEARPFPFEAEYGAYMPIEEIARAFLVELGHKGWVSLETFDRRMRREEDGAGKNAERAKRSWERISRALEEWRCKL